MRSLEERKNGLEEQKRHLTDTAEDLRTRLDNSEDSVQALRSDQSPRGFWKRHFGQADLRQPCFD